MAGLGRRDRKIEPGTEKVSTNLEWLMLAARCPLSFGTIVAIARFQSQEGTLHLSLRADLAFGAGHQPRDVGAVHDPERGGQQHVECGGAGFT